MISTTEKDFLIQGINSNCRTDGRTLLASRPYEAEKGHIKQASGSAKVTQAHTQVLVGIKTTIQETAKGSVEVKIESSNFLERINEEKELLAYQKVVVKMAEYLDLEALNIIPGQSWCIHIDVLILDNGGNVLDAIIYGVRAALEDTRICKVHIESADGVYGFELGDETESLPLEKVPLCTTVALVGHELVVDCNLQEELCASSLINVLVDSKGLICGVFKDLEGGFDPSVLKQVLQIATSVTLAIFKDLNI
jgi:exosome complex component RRP42